LKQSSVVGRQSSNGNVRGDSANTITPANAASGASRRAGGAAGQSGAATRSAAHPTSALLWHVDSAGKVSATRVHVGLSDGQQTEVQGQGITAGMQVIVGTNTGTATTSTSAPASSPFQTQSRGFRGGGF
jgi:hypothetical protein